MITFCWYNRYWNAARKGAHTGGRGVHSIFSTILQNLSIWTTLRHTGQQGNVRKSFHSARILASAKAPETRVTAIRTGGVRTR